MKPAASKKFFLTFFICCTIGVSYGQLKLNEKQEIIASENSVTEFINSNNFDYALIAWSTSNWFRTEDSFSCLLKQEGNWFVARFTSKKYLIPIPARYYLTVDQYPIPENKIDSIWNVVAPISGFQYNQQALNNLPSSCYFMKDGKPNGIGGISDAATYHLLQYSKEGIQTLSYYAPYRYLETCYPHVAEFGILKGMVNTYEKVDELSKGKNR